MSKFVPASVHPKTFSTVGRDSGIRRVLLASVAIYVVGFVVGAALGHGTGFVDVSGLSGVTPLSERQVDTSLERLVLQNVFTVLVLALGFVSLGTITAFLGLLNGFVHGVVVGTMLVELDTPLRVLTLFLPHAVLELPALWLATAVGLYLPVQLLRYARGDQSYLLATHDVRLVFSLTVTAVLLVVASSLVEYYVTLSFV